LKLILLSGGAGKRLWPLSSDMLPKQFIPFLDPQWNEPASMMQKAWAILSDRFGTDNLYIAGNLNHEPILRQQLGSQARLILEPAQRDTFPAIALAASYLHDRAGVDLDETVIVLPVDAYADPTFYDLLPELDYLIRNDLTQLALIGIKPSFASDKFGYIVPVTAPASPGEYCLARGFVEKPDPAEAAELIAQGALWNGGVFAFRLRYLKDAVHRLRFPWSYDELYDRYEALPRISFDYMVAEPEKNIVCIAFDGAWSDLGTWSDMLRLLGKEASGRAILGDDSRNTHIINQLDIPIIVSGISDAVIAAGPDGILISHKSVSHLIKPLVDRLGHTSKT